MRACRGSSRDRNNVCFADNTINGPQDPTPYHQKPRVVHDHEALWWSNDPCCDCTRDSTEKSDSPGPQSAVASWERAPQVRKCSDPRSCPSPSPTQSSSAITLSVAADRPLNCCRPPSMVGLHGFNVWHSPMIYPGIIGQVATF